jgi:4-alpha-glucanotransferase
VDRLSDAGQSWWQALPFGPTGSYNSPYQSLSSFVGNELLISPELLIRDGLLKKDDCNGSFSSTTIDYEVVIPFKRRLLQTAWANFRAGVRKDLVPAYEQFCQDRGKRLEDYALFRALKAKFKGAPFLEWPAELAQRASFAIAAVRRELADEIDQVSVAQFLLSRQAKRLKRYARIKGVRLIGDLPFFVSPDSSDVWANPELFMLDEQRRPRFVAGVPPDYFSAVGQLWGNPVYDWEAHARTQYAWCIDRIRALLMVVDVIRLDHFRAFASAWHVPAEAATAERGRWVSGPGADFFKAVRNTLNSMPFIAEDLGVITPDVTSLREQFRIPGTRVLQFAFDGSFSNVHLPENYSANTVVYTGTHDNATSREWFQDLADRDQRRVWTYLKQSEGKVSEIPSELMRVAWASPAALSIAPFQDLLNLGKDGRMNVPGRAEGNWRWRATPDMLSPQTFQWLSDVTKASLRPGLIPLLSEGRSDRGHRLPVPTQETYVHGS